MIAPPPSLRTDDQIVAYYAPGRGGDRRRHSLGAAGLSADAHVVMTPGDPPDRDGHAVLRDAEARGLAGTGEDLDAARLPERRLTAAAVDSHRQWRAVSRFRDGARRRRRDDGLCLPGHAGRCGAACQARASATRRMICSTPTCR